MSNQVTIRRSRRFRDKNGNEVEVVSTVVRFHNLQQGSKPTDADRKHIEEIGGPDDLVIAAVLWGSGSNLNNLIPIHSKNENFKSLENIIYKLLKENQASGWYAKIAVRLIYKPQQTRTFLIKYLLGSVQKQQWLHSMRVRSRRLCEFMNSFESSNKLKNVISKFLIIFQV